MPVNVNHIISNQNPSTNQHPQQAIRVYQHNVQGFAHSQNAIISNLLQHQPHISLLQEAFRSEHLEEETIDQIKPLLGNIFEIHHSETGRCMIIYRTDINCKPIETPNILLNKSEKFKQYGYESAWIKLPVNDQAPIIFGSIYRNFRSKRCLQQDEQPSQQAFNLQELQNEIKFIKNISTNIILCGDLNANHPTWNSPKVDEIGTQLAQLFKNEQLRITNIQGHEPTYQGHSGSSYIDASICSLHLTNNISEWQVNNPEYINMSDHQPITFKILNPSYNDKLISNRKYRTIVDYNTADWNKFQTIIDNRCQSWIDKHSNIKQPTKQNIDNALIELTQIIKDAQSQSIQ